ncbi:3-oxoacyl-[acyl-carrier protein] reductase [Flexibacter flexilis DSM 6793]|uniref:3-oxoacyl-[acyl-carrier protein] reductase n=1 Tax=Flexibacter flexilis DSM 6793 TaxID=927664 RepID=A0A1I1KMH5_9BACT|nr:SDR family NAD(P)-dependent oxidoreductase [Flexibacter flexilis]SFC61775.1 3-oxoacyl-[acyl-carrier protein] reductase [Flexibacter flexilis DSM 6793]
MDLSTAKVIITGASTGIGYETAKLLASKGAKVVICARNKEAIEKAAAEIGALGVQADVSEEADVTRLFEQAFAYLGGLNVVINNAGVGYMAPLTQTTTEDFTRIWEVNVKGAFLVGRAAARHFTETNTGNIINIASTAGQRGFATGSAYCASKFALSALTECWRAELRKHNVRVMQVNPSEVITEFAPKLGRQPQNVDSKLKASEIAHTIASMLEMNDVGFITDATVWATNPQ